MIRSGLPFQDKIRRIVESFEANTVSMPIRTEPRYCFLSFECLDSASALQLILSANKTHCLADSFDIGLLSSE